MIIKNVRVFQNDTLTNPTNLIIKDGLIQEITDLIKDDTQAEVVDGQGKTLMPGIIDCHAHINSIKNLQDATEYGITTMLDMMSNDNDLIAELRHKKGLTDIRSAYQPVVSEPGEALGPSLGYNPEFCATKEDVRNHIDKQISLGADYIKLVLDEPPIVKQMLPQELINETVHYAHEKGKLVSAHATTVEAYRRAVNGEVDIINHIPRAETMPQEIIDDIKKKNLVVDPTLLMQKGMINNMSKLYPDRAGNYDHVLDTVRRMHEAGVRMIGGTDSNMTNKMNFIPHGEAAHTEIDLWSEAGFSNSEIIHAFTDEAADVFHLSDRGSITPGKRADLILVDGNPLEDIKEIHNIDKVWINGVDAK